MQVNFAQTDKDQLIALQEAIQSAQVKMAESKQTKANLEKALELHNRGVHQYEEAQDIVSERIDQFREGIANTKLRIKERDKLISAYKT